MSRLAVIILEDEVNVQIKHVDPATIRAMIKRVEFFLPHARYSPAYRMGGWNGTTSFMTVGGRTYFTCLERLLPVLREHGYEFDIQDLRTDQQFRFPHITENFLEHMCWPSGHTRAGQPIVLRDYQVDTLNTCLTNLQGVQVLPTSGGKTIVCAALSKIVENYGRSIVIVPNKNLVQQTEEDYRNIDLDAGVLYGDRKEYESMHTICTWQSLNVLDKKNKNSFDTDQLKRFLHNQTALIVDECFEGDCRVLTPDGHIPIKDIKAGDTVINYSEITGEFKTDTVVKPHMNLTKSLLEKMYELEFDNGVKIKVTGNHKFLTNQGWCRADELTEEHEILNYHPQDRTVT